MKVFLHRPIFEKLYFMVPAFVRKAFNKQLAFLLADLRHPSLRAKKYHELVGIWQARITKDWRLYFSIEDEFYNLVDISKHPK